MRIETKTAAFFSDEQHFILHFHGFQLFQVGMAKVYVIFDAQWFYLRKPAVFMALKNLSGIIQHCPNQEDCLPHGGWCTISNARTIWGEMTI